MSERTNRLFAVALCSVAVAVVFWSIIGFVALLHLKFMVKP